MTPLSRGVSCRAWVRRRSWVRGRGWALSLALFALPYYWDMSPAMARLSLRIIDESCGLTQVVVSDGVLQHGLEDRAWKNPAGSSRAFPASREV